LSRGLKVGEEHAVAATFADQDEEFDVANALANHDGEFDAVITLAANYEELSLLSPLQSTRRSTTRHRH
jgi:hypothetical protein